jgi:hypothetical protein
MMPPGKIDGELWKYGGASFVMRNIENYDNVVDGNSVKAEMVRVNWDNEPFVKLNANKPGERYIGQISKEPLDSVSSLKILF